MKKKTEPNEWRMKDEQDNDRCWWWLASLFMAAILALIATACTEEPIQRAAQEPEGLPATIRLEILPDNTTQLQTRVEEKDEGAIKDLHVLVYNSAKELIGKSYSVYSAAKPSFTVDTYSGNNNTIYAIANTGDKTLFDGTVAATETKLKAMKTPALKKWDELTTASHLVMVGSKTKVDIVVGNSTLQGGITVKRIVAKVKLNIGVKAGSGITITDYRVFSLPTLSYYIPNAGADTDVDATTTTTWIDGTTTAVNKTSVSKTFFMYENRKGIVTSITNQKDKGASKAPANASFVVVKGKANGYDAIWRVYLGKNNTSDFNIERNSPYIYNITLNRPGDVDTRIDEISNCYMVPPGSEITIPVIRANESFIELTGSTYNTATKTYDQLQDTTKWTASLVWESSRGLVVLSETTGKGSSGRFKVKGQATAAEPNGGNAVVAIKNYKKEILWSWHIWVTTYDGSTRFSSNNGNRMFVFMDRALGATSAIPGSINSCGLMYQWGRKDPFPGLGQGGSWTASNNTDPTRVYNASGIAFEIAKILVPNVTPNNLTNATRNPNSFYYNADSPTDWFVYSTSSTQNNNLWSGGDISLTTAAKKSVFDPCPSGWRVPLWLNNTSPFAGMISGWTYANYGHNWSGTGGYFPAPGYRSMDRGNFFNIGVGGYYWSGCPSSHLSYLLYSYALQVFPEISFNRACGFNVRCCLDNL